MTNEQLKKIRAIVYDAYCEGDTDAEALLPILDAALAAPEPQPVARVTGYYGGRCVIEPLDGKTVYPTGMAVYSAPVAAQSAQSAQEPVACKHNRYSVDVHEQTGTCYDCGAEGRMRFVVDGTAPPSRESVQPVAEVLMHEGEKIVDASMAWMDSTPIGTQLYAAPPSRKWQSLTDEEIRQVYRSEIGSVTVSEAVMFIAVSRAIESALRAKNTGEQNG